jgi:dihydrodipicolinate synthase/N-acetylneuraminate lyase
METSIKALIVPLITPFNEDYSIDFFGLKTFVASLLNKGVTNFFVLSPFSEEENLSISTQRQIFLSVLKEVSINGNVLVACFGKSSDEIISKIKFCEKHTKYCVINIPYDALTNEISFVDFFDKVFTKTKAKIILYNDPILFKRNIPIVGINRIAGWEKLVGIFDNSKNILYFKALSNYHQSLKIFQCSEKLAIESLNYNSWGFVLGLSNVLPTLFLNKKTEFDKFGYNSLIRDELNINKFFDVVPRDKPIQFYKKILSNSGLIQNFVSKELKHLEPFEEKLASKFFENSIIL